MGQIPCSTERINSCLWSIPCQVVHNSKKSRTIGGRCFKRQLGCTAHCSHFFKNPHSWSSCHSITAWNLPYTYLQSVSDKTLSSLCQYSTADPIRNRRKNNHVITDHDRQKSKLLIHEFHTVLSQTQMSVITTTLSTFALTLHMMSVQSSAEVF